MHSIAKKLYETLSFCRDYSIKSQDYRENFEDKLWAYTCTVSHNKTGRLIRITISEGAVLKQNILHKTVVQGNKFITSVVEIDHFNCIDRETFTYALLTITAKAIVKDALAFAQKSESSRMSHAINACYMSMNQFTNKTNRGGQVKQWG